MNKTPQELLEEVQRLAEQSAKDYEALKNFIQAQKAYEEIQQRLNGNTPINPVAHADQYRTSKTKRVAVGAGRKPGVSHIIVFKGITRVIKDANRFLRYSDIRPLADQLAVNFPKKSIEEIDKLIRNLLFKDRQSASPRFAHKREGDSLPVRYTYGLHEFLNADGTIKTEHEPIK